MLHANSIVYDQHEVHNVAIAYQPSILAGAQRAPGAVDISSVLGSLAVRLSEFSWSHVWLNLRESSTTRLTHEAYTSCHEYIVLTQRC